MKTPVKIILIVVMWLFVIVIGGSESENAPSNNGEDKINNQSNELNNIDITETDDEQKQDEVVRYHKNDGVNQILTDYSKCAEIEITPEMVEKGAYDFNCKIIVNEAFIMIYNSSNGYYVDFSDEYDDDSHIYPLFRDFAKALDSTLSDDDLDATWKELQTGNYQNYTKYSFGSSLQATYNISKLNNGTFRYSIKLEKAK